MGARVYAYIKKWKMFFGNIVTKNAFYGCIKSKFKKIEGRLFDILIKINIANKCTTTNTTGTFFWLPKDCLITDIKPLFEYVIVIKLDENFQPLSILEFDWETFFKHKHWYGHDC